MHRKTRRSRVLIVIPTLGERLDLLKQTLHSLTKQDAEKPDIIVVCPRKPEVRQLAKKFGAAIADDPGGLSAALNVGFALARPWHEYGAWMGDDDLLRPGSLKTTVNTLDANPQAILAFGYCEYVNNSGRVLFTNRAGRLALGLMKWGPNLVPLPGLLYRLAAVREAGNYDESLKYSMDLDMWLRLKKKGSFVNTHKVLGAFRWHPTSTTVANRNASLNEAEIVKRRYLSKFIRPLAIFWEKPVRFATKLAANRLNIHARD